MPWLAGVDGCKAGWVAALLNTRSGALRLELHPAFAAIVSSSYRPAVIAVDMPIGLPSVSAPRRACDAEARKLLGPRRSSIFSPPLREVVALGDYAKANALSRRLSGLGLSKQAFFLMPKIREVEAVLLSRPACAIRECHPELAFVAMNAGVPLVSSKRTPSGERRRRALLARYLGPFAAKAPLHYPGLLPDDILDALACLWSARRIFQGAARALPRSPECDAMRLPMEISF